MKYNNENQIAGMGKNPDSNSSSKHLPDVLCNTEALEPFGNLSNVGSGLKFWKENLRLPLNPFQGWDSTIRLPQ